MNTTISKPVQTSFVDYSEIGVVTEEMTKNLREKLNKLPPVIQRDLSIGMEAKFQMSYAEYCEKRDFLKPFTSEEFTQWRDAINFLTDQKL